MKVFGGNGVPMEARMAIRHELVECINAVDEHGADVLVLVLDEIVELEYLDGSQADMPRERIALHPDGYRLTITADGFRQLGGDAAFTRA
jgi:hypothetical protein